MSRNGERRRECDHFRLPACNAEATSAHIVDSFSDFPLETLPAAPFAPLERVHQGGEIPPVAALARCARPREVSSIGTRCPETIVRSDARWL